VSIENAGMPSSTDSEVFPGKLGIVQRVIPPYRVPLFDALAERCTGGLEILAGEPIRGESIRHNPELLRRATVVPAGNLYLARGSASYVCFQRGGTEWLRTSQPHVLIIEANPRILSSPRLANIARGYGAPVVGWGLGALPSSNPGVVENARHRFLRWFYRRFDGFFAYSTKAAGDYVQDGAPEERVLVVGNAVAGKAASQIDRELAADPRAILRWRAELGLGDRRVVIFVGRLIPSKRVDDLILACSRLPDRVDLLIVGDGAERPALERVASSVFPTTRFLGERHGRELGKVLALSDLLVLPGPGGLAVQEAMLYGLPVIVGSGDGTQADLVHDGQNGYLVPDGDIDTLASRIWCVMSDEDLRTGLGVEARGRAEEWNLDSVVSRFISGSRSAVSWS
jgi:glycosyltransferase involved in cell wall biosynthesis